MYFESTIRTFYMKGNVAAFSFIIWLVSLFFLFCNQKARFEVPKNYMLVCVTTAGLASFIASIVSVTSPETALFLFVYICIALFFLFGTAFVSKTVSALERNLFKALFIACIVSFLLPYAIYMIM